MRGAGLRAGEGQSSVLDKSGSKSLRGIQVQV